MATDADSDERIPVICVDKTAWTSAEIFNPNDWSDASKGIVQSCWAECSVLRYCADQMARLCKESEKACRQHIHSIQQQWHMSKFDLERLIIYGEVPELHVLIEAFFSGVKTLLDLLAQLLSCEKIVGGVVHGFHQDKGIYGGNVLHALDGKNVSKNRKAVATKVRALISEHKMLWIDQSIQARHYLVHPQKGAYQLMFHLDFAEQGNNLNCVKISPPMVGSEAIDQYAQRILKHTQEFSTSFLGLLREGAVADNCTATMR